MRKVMLVLCLCIMTFLTAPLYANPPQKVILSYDQHTHALTVEVMHRVADPSTHHVERIQILLNDKMVLEKEPPLQNEDGLSISYPLADVKPGHVVQAIAFCSKGGELSGQIQIS